MILMIRLLLTLLILKSNWVGSIPVDTNLEFDNLDVDLSNLSYPVEEEDIDDYEIIYDESIDKAKAKEKEKISGLKKKKSKTKGEEKKYDIKDLKKFYKTTASHDAGIKDDGDVYGSVKGLSTSDLGVAGNETRIYKKRSKSKGHHSVQHKDDYKKDNEFYEDDITSGIIKKNGAKRSGVKIGGGLDFNHGYYHHDHDKGLSGKRGVSDVGSAKKQFKGFSESEELDEYLQVK